MSNRARRISISVVTASTLLLSALPVPAFSQVQYGAWQKTGDCRPAGAPSGFLRGAVQLPQAGGGAQATECKWVREVQDCPRVRDNLAHPIRCTTRKDKSGYSLYPPK